MIQRCRRKGHNSYRYYGGRGICVCERWHVFENFLADMGEKPPGLTIDRIDCNGNYEPGNCRWMTAREQSRNQRSNVLSVDAVNEIIGRFEHGEKRSSIARRFNMNPAYISQIVSGKAWSDIDRPYLAKA
jgi:hypothetical protein